MDENVLDHASSATQDIEGNSHCTWDYFTDSLIEKNIKNLINGISCLIKLGMNWDKWQNHKQPGKRNLIKYEIFDKVSSLWPSWTNIKSCCPSNPLNFPW